MVFTSVIEKDRVTLPKPLFEWSSSEIELVTWNTKGLNAIFNVVDANQFIRLISTCIEAMTWNKLEVAYEGIEAVK